MNLGAKQLSTNVITLWHAKERKDASKSNGTSFAFVYITNEKKIQKNTYRNVYYYLNAQFLLDTFKLSLKNGYCRFFLLTRVLSNNFHRNKKVFTKIYARLACSS